MENVASNAGAVQRLYDGNTFRANNPDQNRLVVKNGSHFLVLSESGVIPKDITHSPFGIYRDDTRYLSSWEMFVNGSSMRMLSSNLNAGFEADFVYGNQTASGLHEQSLMIRRQIVVADHVHEKITIRNYNPKQVNFEFAIAYGADFADIFEVRGTVRTARGNLHSPRLTTLRGSVGGKRIRLCYDGLDGKAMQTVIDLRSRIKLKEADDGVLFCQLSLEAGQSVEIDAAFHTALLEPGDCKSSQPKKMSFAQARNKALSLYDEWGDKAAKIETGSEDLNRLLEQSFRDLFLLRQPVPGGHALAAGLPWFACAFGRDQAIAGMQVLPFFPKVAREVILNLAYHQGQKLDPYREEKPGKIMHELRLGETARNKETPFTPYYGTADATPLWLMLLSRYVDWSGDEKIAEELWSNIKLAVSYLEEEMRISGYLTYGGSGFTTALANQGWKDSPDSVMYSDGELAEAPIALVEVQGYLYSALTGAAKIAQNLNKTGFAKHLDALAQSLKERFQQDFWMKEKDFPAIALDSDGKMCDVVSSNPGHLIGTGILTGEQEERVANRLMQEDMFSNWGIRTLSEQESAYNPMSYHNGSIWPHDNAMIVDGMSHSGQFHTAHRILSALVALSQFRQDGRLPELICGFASNHEEGPISYPISCSPQAWSAGAPLQIIASCLGITFDAKQNIVTISNPSIPDWIGTVRVQNLRFGKLSVSLMYKSEQGKTTCRVESKSRSLKVRFAG